MTLAETGSTSSPPRSLKPTPSEHDERFGEPQSRDIAGGAASLRGPSAQGEITTKTESRLLSDNELSYYLPSRANGLNDVYVQQTYIAPTHLITPERYAIALAILKMKHPLIGARIVPGRVRGVGMYEDTRFEYTLPISPEDALEEARQCIIWLNPSSPSRSPVSNTFNPASLYSPSNASIPHKPFDKTYISLLNGPRILSDDRLFVVHVEVGERAGVLPLNESPCGSYGAGEEGVEYTTCSQTIVTAHSTSDAAGIHMLLNDFYCVLGSFALDGGGQEEKSEAELFSVLKTEWEARAKMGRHRSAAGANSKGRDPTATVGSSCAGDQFEERIRRILPRSFEERVFGDGHEVNASLKERIGARKIFDAEMAALRGGQAFARYPPPISTPSSLSFHSYPTATPSSPNPDPPLDHHVFNLTFTHAESIRLTSICRSNKVSFNSMLFAVLNVAWQRVLHEEHVSQGQELLELGLGFGKTDVRGRDVDVKIPRAGSANGWPSMIYAASDIRQLVPESYSSKAGLDESPVALALSYFNIMLPPPDMNAPVTFSPALANRRSIRPTSLHRAPYRQWECDQLWAQARLAKIQQLATRDPQGPNGELDQVERCRFHIQERLKKAITFAKMDDGVEVDAQQQTIPSKGEPKKKKGSSAPASPQEPAVPLIGASCPGDLTHRYSGSPYYNHYRHLHPSKSSSQSTPKMPQSKQYPTIHLLHCVACNRKAIPGGSSKAKTLTPLVFCHTTNGRIYITVGWEGKSWVTMDRDEGEEGKKRGIRRYCDVMEELFRAHLLGQGVESEENAAARL